VACLKYSVLIFVEKIYKMKHLEGSGLSALYNNNNNNILLTAIGLSPGGSGYFTYKQS
jgi:hypothetical protein